MGQQESSLGSAGYLLPSAAGSLHRASSSSASAPSTASSGVLTRRRLDMRWGRLTTDQLRDEEFLTKQLRRMETLLGANARRQHTASTGRNASSSLNVNALASRAVFASATPSRLSLQQRLIRGKAGDATSSHSLDDEGDDSALAGGPESDRSTANVKQCELLAEGEADIRKELDLLNALFIFGELEQPELAALMLQKLKELLLRLCTFPDPFYDLLALRRYILRSVHEAVQHQHQRALVNLSSVALESIRNAILQAQVPQLSLLPSARGYSGSTSLITARRRSAATTRIPGVDSSVPSTGILLPPIKSKEKIAREASMGIQVVFSLFTSMMEQSSTSLSQRKEILNELLPLIQDLPPQSLAPKSITQTLSSSKATPGSVAGRGISSGNGSLVSTVAAESQELVERIQRFLLEICPTSPMRPGPSSPKVQAVAPSAGEFDVSDRTNSVNALLFLAAARSSLRDFLLAVKVILGAGDYSTDTKENHQPAVVSPRLASPLASSVSLLKTKFEDQHPASCGSGEWEQDDAGVISLKHNSRLDAGIAIDLKLGTSKYVQSSHRADSEAVLSSTQDLMNQVKRKALPKGFVPKVIGSTSTSNTVNVSLAHPVTHHHHRFTSSPIASAVTGGYKSRMKEDLKELLQNGNAAFSLDMSMMQDTNSSSSRDGFASAHITSRHDGLVQTVKCPKLKPLSVCSVLHELDIAKASIPQKMSRSNSRASSYKASGGILSGELHGDNMLFPGEDDCEDKEVWSCGQNSYGELGHGDTITRKSFDRIEALQRKDVAQVSAGNEHSIVLCGDGTVFTCGYNDNGQCGVGVTNRVGNITEIHKFGEHAITQVHAYNGCEHSVIVTEEGRAATFGYNYRGQLGHGNTTSENVPKLVRSLEARIVRLVSCSYYHTILTCDEVGGGREYVYTFGRNDYGQLGHNDTIDRKVPHFIETLAEQHIVSVACGQYHTIVVSSSGKAYGFGKNDYGQLGIDSIENQLVPVQVRSGLEKYVCLEIRCGYYHSIVLCSGAHLFGFGRNDYGQLGLGKANATPAANLQLQQQRFAAPQLIEELEGKEIIRFACGCYHTVAVSDSGMLYVFGRNNHGQLGTGDTTEKLFPFPIEDFLGKRIAMVAAGFYHTIVLTGGKEEEKCDQGAEDNGNGNDDTSGDNQSLLSSTFILAAHNVRQILDRNAAAVAADSEENGKQIDKTKQKEKHRRVAEAADACADPSWNPDDEDCRDEDDSWQNGRHVLEAVAAASEEESCDDMLGESSSSPKLKISGVDSIDTAVIILAELDRLCKPYLPKQGMYPALQHPSSEAMELLQASLRPSPSIGTAFDVCGLFDGCFEAHVVHTCSSTFESLCVLAKHLSGKKIEHLSRMQHHGTSSAQTARASIQGISSVQLQVYILLACIRLLQANLAQLLRSGLGKTVLLAAQARDSHLSTADVSSSMKELERILVVLHQIRDLLMSLVDIRQRSSSIFGSEVDAASHEMAAKIASEAVETLMLGFELFFPCPCEQCRFFLYVIENHNDSAMGCGICDSGGDGTAKYPHATESYPRSRKLLLVPLLRRMAEDSLVVKWLPLVTSSSTSVPKTVSANSKPLSVITTVYSALLERIGTDFTRAIGGAARFSSNLGSTATMGNKSVATSSSHSNLFNVVIVFQKHISTWAASCERWVMKSDRLTADPRLSIADKVAMLVDRVFRVDYHDLDDVPLPWRCFLEFTQAILCQCCDVFLQVISRESVPSPSFGHASTRPAPAASYGDEHRSLFELLEASIVGQVLPSVVSSLLVFSNNPLFAVALLPHTKNLLHLVDDFNIRNPDIREMDRTLGQIPQFGGSGTGSSSSRGRPSLTSKKGLLRGMGAAPTSSDSGATIGEVVSLPWSYLLEKEVAVLAAEMAVTLKIADPLFGFETSQGDPTTANIPSRRWFSSPLFSGGLSTSVIRKSIKQSVNTEMAISDATRIVQHVPLWTNSKAEPSMTFDTRPFSLVLPSYRYARRLDEDAQWTNGTQTPTVTDVDNYTEVFSGASVGNFLASMSGDQRSGDCFNAHVLCDWIRAHYAKTNASYRMLTRQTKPAAGTATTPDVRFQDESCIEYAAFAAMLHHNQLAHQALHFALSLNSADSTTPSKPPPRVFLSLWHFVAELRRRFSAKKTEIKNLVVPGIGAASLPESDSSTAVLQLQRAIVERSQLLLLVSIQEENEQKQMIPGGGFVAPCDPAVHETDSSSSVYFASSRLPKMHLQTVYRGHQVPFLVAFPNSKWRRVRILMHVMTRWRWIGRAWHAQKVNYVSSEILDFLTTNETVESSAAINLLLVDPCRRGSCATRGLESMCEVLSIPSFEAIQADVVHRYSQVVVFQSHAVDSSLTRPKSPNIGLFFKEQYDEALSEFLAQVTKSIVKKSQALFASLPAASCESEILVKCRPLIMLLSCWAMHFKVDHFEFINDIGILSILQEISTYVFKSKLSTSSTSGGSSGSIMGSSDQNFALDTSKSFDRLADTLWVLFRHICVHFAVQVVRNDESTAATTTIGVPTEPALSDIFDLIFDQTLEIAQSVLSATGRTSGVVEDAIPKENIPETARMNSSVPSTTTMRRSFEIIWTPKRFSSLSKGLSFTYEEMITPPSGCSPNRPAMSPLVKPNEFSITTWIYTSELPEMSNRDSPMSSRLTPREQEPRFIFLRGNHHEVGPYLTLVLESDNSWHFEVGMLINLRPEAGSVVPSSSSANVFKYIAHERMTSKESVTPKKWIHVGIVCEASKIQLYINGILDTQRNLLQAHATALSCASVDLPFHFGRCPSTLLSLPESSSASPSIHPVVSSLRLLASALTSKSTFSRNGSSLSASESDTGALKSFDGALGNFRFHNRSLSPIHVRIVYDEKKQNTSISAGTPRTILPVTRTEVHTHRKLLDQLAVLLLLSSSSEGLLHFLEHASRWLTLLWELFIKVDELRVQQSVLRVLRGILPHQSPLVLYSVLTEGMLSGRLITDDEILAALGFISREDAFVQQIVRIIGFTACKCPHSCVEVSPHREDQHIVQLPWTLMLPAGIHGNELSPSRDELKAANWSLHDDIEKQDHTASTQSLALGNELVGLLQHLYASKAATTSSKWRDSIQRTVLSQISDACERSKSSSSQQPEHSLRIGQRVVSLEIIRRIEDFASLYVISGVVDFTRPGAVVELSQAGDVARVIALDPVASKSPTPSALERSTAKRQLAYVSICDVRHRHDKGRSNSLQWGGDIYDSWYERVLNYSCVRHSDPDLQGVDIDTTATRPRYLCVNTEDIQPARAISSAKLPSAFAPSILYARRVKNESFLMTLVPVLTGACLQQLNPEREELFNSSSSSGELRLMRDQSSSVMLKALVHVSASSEFAQALLGNTELVERVFELSTSQDGNASFATCADIERKVSLLRQRVYKVLIAMEDEGDVELQQLFRTSRAVQRRLSNELADLKSERRASNSLLSPEKTLEDEEAISSRLNERQLRRSRRVSEQKSGNGPASQIETADTNGEEQITDGSSPVAKDDGSDLEEDDDDNDGNDNEENDEDDLEDDDDDEDEEEDEGDEEEEDEDTEENRAEFVEELMLMGFPEEWCILALKQTENDIVCASAWIVDNLEYLSRLQTSLDKQRDQGRETPRFNEEEDDNVAEDGGDGGAGNGFETQESLAQATGLVDDQSLEDGTATTTTATMLSKTSAVCTIPPLNDKEMARKVFGEMYFPFEDGGYRSNTRHCFMRSWRGATVEMKLLSPTKPQNPLENLDANAGSHESMQELSQYHSFISQMDLKMLVNTLQDLEHTLSVLYARQCLVVLCYHISQLGSPSDATLAYQMDYPHFFQLVKMVLLRGNQFNVIIQSNSDGTCDLQERTPEQVLLSTIAFFLKHDFDTFVLAILDFSVNEIEKAALNKTFEAHLWTQRELTRADKAVNDEPAIEIVSWIVDVVLKQSVGKAWKSSQVIIQLIKRLRFSLKSTNLPLKFLGLHMISIILQKIYKTGGDDLTRGDSIMFESKLEIGDFMHAAKQRHAREVVQHRLVFSVYLQAYVEILHVLLQLTGHVDSKPEICALSGSSFTSLSSPPRKASTTSGQLRSLAFDRKRCRSNLLTISDDGSSVAYLGNEVWKTVFATESFSTGVISWQVRIDKSGSSYLFIGVGNQRASSDSFLGADDHSWGYIGDKALYYQRNRVKAYGDNFGEGDCIGVTLDCEKGTMSFTKNGVDLGIAFDNIVGEVCPAVAFYSRHQHVSFVPESLIQEDQERENAQVELDEDHKAREIKYRTPGSVEEALAACELMTAMINKQPVPEQLLRSAYEMTTQWISGSKKYVTTRAGKPLWVDVTRDNCSSFGFQSGERVRTSRGNGVVVGVAEQRLWVEVDGEQGAWFFHPSKLRSLTLISVNTSATAKASQPLITGQDKLSSSANVSSFGTSDATSEPSASFQSEAPPTDLLSFTEFQAFVNDSRWSLAIDQEIMSILNDYCETSSMSPWNVSPPDALNIIKQKESELENLLSRTGYFPSSSSISKAPGFEAKLVSRMGFLRFFNAYFSRVIAYFDLTWHYFAPETSLLPCKLVSKCRGSLFIALKNEFFTALMEKTANSPKKADDDYDYPEDLPQVMLNRPKAATAKCHPGTTKSLFLSLFGQAFEELHFLPLRTLRMVYSHPMDDGQLRSFKVKFEGEGVDDYGGPYREFFSQFFAELQMLRTEHEENELSGGGESTTSESKAEETPTECLLPFLLPSPNWRNGVGANREKFVINAALLREPSQAMEAANAQVVNQSRHRNTTGASHRNKKQQRDDANVAADLEQENPEEKRQLHGEMFFFLGQMLGTCLRTRVCVRLDLAISVWKHLAGEVEDDEDGSNEQEEAALQNLKEVDFVAYTLWKTLRGVLTEHQKLQVLGVVDCNDHRVQDLEQQLEAMDLTFTTFLSDGHVIELCEDGSTKTVTLDNLELYLKAVLRARMDESNDVMNIIKQGLNSILPVTALGLFTWRELEKRVCGVAEVDVELLKKNTEYDEDVSPNDEFVQRFWRVLAAMDEEDKRCFLRFVWARSRLPAGTAQFHQKFKIQSVASSSSTNGGGGETGGSGGTADGWMDSQLPKSHTCFFALQLPRYSNDEICRKQMLYAVRNCVEMDGDFRLADTEMTGWNDIDPTDQLRF